MNQTPDPSPPAARICAMIGMVLGLAIMMGLGGPPEDAWSGSVRGAIGGGGGAVAGSVIGSLIFGRNRNHHE